VNKQDEIKYFEKHKKKIIKMFQTIAQQLTAHEYTMKTMMKEDVTIPEAIIDYARTIRYQTNILLEPFERKRATELKKLSETCNIKVYCPNCKKPAKIEYIEFEDSGDGFDPENMEYWSVSSICENPKCYLTENTSIIQLIVNREEEENDN